ncbi:hypothetical protein PACTADRAFT_34607 [Pachysolen tannophilus NRRL Y-2460]|uniref:Protein YOP1 n=1 Tax=Pachysolen tannophilus NRRL Y-2460 TaxID=669874 RepID=A0A1E4TSV6_PACTA|nr:hypothetical protein PACTADRAFT_34607 [Pachysolen tannophilus NRRL Y-2460]
MSDYVGQAQQILGQLDKQFAGFKLLDQFESSTKLPRSYAVLGTGVFYFFLIFLNVGGIGQLLSNIAGFVIPGYYSLVALETRTSSDDTQLLTYWVVFAFLNVIEFWSKALLYWVPLYWFVKTILLLWLALPQFGGANIIYGSFIKPFSQKYILGKKGIADDVINKVNEASKGKSSGVELH